MGFSYRGVHCSTYGIVSRTLSRVLAPARRWTYTSIPGRHGVYASSDGAYEPYELQLELWFKPQSDVPARAREIAAWLSVPGELTLDTEPSLSYTAHLSGAPPQEQHVRHGHCTLSFRVNPPFALSAPRSVPIAVGVTDVSYAGSVPAPAVITLTNTTGADVSNILLVVRRKGS